MIKVSIIIPYFNNHDIIENTLESIGTQDGVFIETIVVDDASNNNSLKQLKNFKKKFGFQIISNEFNEGYAASCNNGATHASYDYLIMMNSDAYFTSNDQLQKLMEYYISNKNIGVLGLKQLNLDNSIQYIGSDIDIFCNINTLKNKDIVKGFLPCLMPGGACFLVSKEIFDTVGQLDSRYYLYGEELDFMWRVMLIGYQNGTYLDTSIFHVGGKSTGNSYNHETNSQKIYLRERNALITVYKNLSVFSLFYVIPLKLASILAECLISLILFKPKVSLAYYKSVRDSIKGLTNTLQLRKYIQNNRKKSDIQLIKAKAINITNYKYVYVIKKGLPKVS